MTALAPVHPGEVLLEVYLRPLGLSQNRLAVAIGVRPWRINWIIRGKRPITAGAALRLSCYFGTTDRFWLTSRSGTTSRARRQAWERRSSGSSHSRPPERITSGAWDPPRPEMPIVYWAGRSSEEG